MKRKNILQTLSMFMTVMFLSGSTSVYAAENTLTVGVRGDIMNFGYYNETTGKFYGMEIDLAYELAERLGYEKVKFQEVQPDNRKDMLQNGAVDCLIAAYSITDTRVENFDFSPAYYTDSTMLMVEKSTMIEKVQDLKGKTIGILTGVNAGPILAGKLYDMGFTGDIVAKEDNVYIEYENLTIVQMESYAEVSTALEEGTIDAACLDRVIAKMYWDDDRRFLPFDLAEQSYGVATQKNSELSEKMGAAVQELLDDGTIEALIDKWD